MDRSRIPTRLAEEKRVHTWDPATSSGLQSRSLTTAPTRARDTECSFFELLDAAAKRYPRSSQAYSLPKIPRSAGHGGISAVSTLGLRTF